jgi:N-acetylglucosaminyl-diphospho-decaprenol L-rhamnosyltransferase
MGDGVAERERARRDIERSVSRGASPGAASLIFVNYHSAALVRQAVGSARSTTSIPLQIIVVDNSADDRELRALGACGADLVLAAPANRGYGAGINLGRARATEEVIVASNPDVIFHAGCIDLLVRSLQAPVGIAGPALFWDDGLEWHLPPADRPGLRAALAALLRSRSIWIERLLGRRDVLRRIAFWTARSPALAGALSGAVLAIRRDVFDELGGFDERFFLYFEEHDLIRRASQRGWRSMFVPAARCRHLYNQSARSSPEARAHYASSARSYAGKGVAAEASALLERLTRPRRLQDVAEVDSILLEGRPDELLIEASPLAGFATAAGYFPQSGTVSVPGEVWTTYQDDLLYLRAVRRRTGRTVATWVRKKHLEFTP